MSSMLWVGVSSSSGNVRRGTKPGCGVDCGDCSEEPRGVHDTVSTHPSFPVLSEKAGAKDAIVWLRAVTKWIGPGFHPDTRASDYVHGDSGEPLLTAAEAERLDKEMKRCATLLVAEGRDPCEVAIKVQRRLMR